MQQATSKEELAGLLFPFLPPAPPPARLPSSTMDRSFMQAILFSVAYFPMVVQWYDVAVVWCCSVALLRWCGGVIMVMMGAARADHSRRI